MWRTRAVADMVQRWCNSAETILKVRRISLIGSPSFVIYLHYFSACYGRFFLFIYQNRYISPNLLPHRPYLTIECMRGLEWLRLRLTSMIGLH